MIALVVGLALGWTTTFLRPPGSARRNGLHLSAGALGGLGGGFVLGPLMGGGNLFEMLIDPMTAMVAAIGAATALAALVALRRRFSRARSLPTE